MQKVKFIPLLLLLLLFVVFVFSACQSDSDLDKLVIYNWADYIYDFEDDFAEYYKEQTGRDIKITYVTFDTNETMLTRVLKGDSNIDVMCPSEYAIQKLLEADALEKLNYFTSTEFENSGFVEREIINRVDEAFEGFKVNGQSTIVTDYFVPYMYGTLGILYNADVLEEEGISNEDLEEAGWGVLFNKNKDGSRFSEVLKNRIFMKDSIRDSYAAAVFYLLESGQLQNTEYENLSVNQLINCVDDKMIAMVKEVLIEQKQELYGYEVDFGKNELIAQNAYVDLAWSGDAMYAIEEAESYGVNLDYFVPSVAGNIWFDGWVMPKTAKNKTAGKLFIDFLNSPVVAVQNMLEIGYSSAVSQEAIQSDFEAMEILMEEYEFFDVDEFIDFYFVDIRYPLMDTEKSATLGVMKDFGERNNAVVRMWETVRSTGITAWWLLLWTVVVLGGAVGIFVAVYFIRQRKKRYVKV